MFTNSNTSAMRARVNVAPDRRADSTRTNAARAETIARRNTRTAKRNGML